MMSRMVWRVLEESEVRTMLDFTEVVAEGNGVLSTLYSVLCTPFTFPKQSAHTDDDHSSVHCPENPRLEQ